MFYVFGIAICLAALLQMGMWISSSVSQMKFNRFQLDASRDAIQQQIQVANEKRMASLEQGNDRWSGYREFHVDRLEKENEFVTSVYLKPVDGKPIVDFRAGQHLPLRFQIPNEPNPVVRCYSLSAGPDKDYYRISVKAVPAPHDRHDLVPGKVSNFINQQLMEGDKVGVKAPGGSFYLEEKSDSPVVLLAGGIGITPMMSMMERLISTNSERLIVLFYGVRCGEEHTFKKELNEIASRFNNVHIVNCYSNPASEDQLNKDYQVQGFVSVDLMKVLLPDNRCRFYMCGPPPFMNSIRDGLLEWDVPENRINFEAFGPASIKKTSPKIKSDGGSKHKFAVKFAESGVESQWDNELDSILELAEANDVNLDSGCRAGSCGTCAIKLLKGEVDYPEGSDVDCKPGECLVCIAKPKQDIELDA